jgi:hypothetical protein
VEQNSTYNQHENENEFPSTLYATSNSNISTSNLFETKQNDHNYEYLCPSSSSVVRSSGDMNCALSIPPIPYTHLNAKKQKLYVKKEICILRREKLKMIKEREHLFNKLQQETYELKQKQQLLKEQQIQIDEQLEKEKKILNEQLLELSLKQEQLKKGNNQNCCQIFIDFKFQSRYDSYPRL